MTSNIIKINTWNELHEELFKDWWWPKIGRFRAPLAFRGLSDNTYKLSTTLMRLGGNYTKLEPHLLKNFSKYAGKDLTKYSGQDITKFDSLWHWMIIGQHHGLPTRLLDWTYSPLVAMYFATWELDKFENADGVIWIINFIEIIKYLPEKIKGVLIENDLNVFTLENLSQIFTRELDALKKLDAFSDSQFVIFIEPPSIDDRIINQFGLFSFMSHPDLNMDDWLMTHQDPKLWRKIIIPRELKVEIKDKLSQSNISARTLFPGLDGLCTWLKNYYSPGKTHP